MGSFGLNHNVQNEGKYGQQDFNDIENGHCPHFLACNKSPFSDHVDGDQYAEHEEMKSPEVDINCGQIAPRFVVANIPIMIQTFLRFVGIYNLLPFRLHHKMLSFEFEIQRPILDVEKEHDQKPWAIRCSFENEMKFIIVVVCKVIWHQKGCCRHYHSENDRRVEAKYGIDIVAQRIVTSISQGLVIPFLDIDFSPLTVQTAHAHRCDGDE